MYSANYNCLAMVDREPPFKIKYSGLYTDRLDWQHSKFNKFCQVSGWPLEATVITSTPHVKRPQVSQVGDILIWRSVANPLDRSRWESDQDQVSFSFDLATREANIEVHDQIIAEDVKKSNDGDITDQLYAQRLSRVLRETIGQISKGAHIYEMRSYLPDRVAKMSLLALDAGALMFSLGILEFGCYMITESIVRTISDDFPGLITDQAAARTVAMTAANGLVFGALALSIKYPKFREFLDRIPSLNERISSAVEPAIVEAEKFFVPPILPSVPTPFGSIRNYAHGQLYLNTEGKELVTVQSIQTKIAGD